jgi:hypothetical protein
MAETSQVSNLVGAIIANVNNILLIFLFVARIKNKALVEHWLGLIIILSIFPLVYLFVNAFTNDRQPIYFIQIGLMISFLIVELILDNILKADFRNTQSIVIPYVILFFAGVGGMIGVASHAGKFWTIATVVSFLAMTASAIVMHIITGE